MLRLLEMKYNIFSTFNPSFFMDPDPDFSGSDPDFSGSDPDSEEKADPDPGKKPGSETLQ